MRQLHYAQRYVEKYSLPLQKAPEQKRREMWAEVAHSNTNQETRNDHAEALGEQVAAEIAAVTEAARNNDIKALEELASVVLTREIMLDVLKENISGLVLETAQLGPLDSPYYMVKRLNKTGLFNNVPTWGAVPSYHVAHMYQMIPIMVADNQSSYVYRTRNQYVGAVEERDEAAAEIRRGILENRERTFINMIRAATLVDGAGNNINVMPDMIMANDMPAPTSNVVMDSLAVGLSKKNLADLMFKLELYNYSPKTLYCSARRKNDIRNFITTTSTSDSPVDFFTQREILTTGKMEGLFGLEIRVLNYLRDDECYMWDNSQDFGSIYLRGGVQIEDRQGPQAFMRELVAAQIEGQALFNARRIVKLQLV
jgi:hypothetical protein